jgi:hypothetical protein
MVSDPFQEDVMKLLAVTLSMIVLNKFRNKEILRNFQKQSKNQNEPAIVRLFEGKETTTVKSILSFIGIKSSRNHNKHTLQILERYAAFDYPNLISKKSMISFVN